MRNAIHVSQYACSGHVPLRCMWSIIYLIWLSSKCRLVQLCHTCIACSVRLGEPVIFGDGSCRRMDALSEKLALPWEYLLYCRHSKVRKWCPSLPSETRGNAITQPRSHPIPKFYIFLMGWNRGWVISPCFFTFWGVEYDRPSLNPFCFSENCFLLVKY